MIIRHLMGRKGESKAGGYGESERPSAPKRSAYQHLSNGSPFGLPHHYIKPGSFGELSVCFHMITWPVTMGQKKLDRPFDGEYYNRRFEEVDSKQHSYYRYADDTEDAITRMEAFWKELIISPPCNEFFLTNMPTDTAYRSRSTRTIHYGSSYGVALPTFFTGCATTIALKRWDRLKRIGAGFLSSSSSSRADAWIRPFFRMCTM